MSTLTELADYITTKLNKTDAASVAKCKTFLNNQYEFIWNFYAWRDIKGLGSVSVSAGDQTVTMPSACGEVLGLRWGLKQELSGLEMENILRQNPEDWDQEGDPYGWSRMGKDGNGDVLVRLAAKPREADTLYVLYKRKWAALTDNDTPEISGIETALKAFGEAEFLESRRQYGKAQVKYQEGGAKLAAMRNLEIQQSGVTRQFLPDDGGWDGCTTHMGDWV